MFSQQPKMVFRLFQFPLINLHFDKKPKLDFQTFILQFPTNQNGGQVDLLVSQP